MIIIDRLDPDYTSREPKDFLNNVISILWVHVQNTLVDQHDLLFLWGVSQLLLHCSFTSADPVAHLQVQSLQTTGHLRYLWVVRAEHLQERKNFNNCFSIARLENGVEHALPEL